MSTREAVRPTGPPVTGPPAAEPPAPVAVPRAPFLGLVLALVIGGVLGILLLNTKINENAFVLYELREEQAELDRRQEQLEQEIAQASSAAQLAAAARRMGLEDRQEDLEYLHVPRTQPQQPAGGGDDDAPAQ